MNIRLRYLTIILSVCLVFFNACREESDELIEAEEDQMLESSSEVANLMLRAAKNDGSKDDVLDGTSCLSIQLPVKVMLNGLEIVVDSEDDFEDIEEIFDNDDNDDEEDELIIQFPIVVILNDFTEIEVNDQEQLESLIENCEEQEEDEEDIIECLDFQYPLSASVFDIPSEVVETATFNNDRQFFRFLRNLDDENVVNLVFPINLILSDETVLLTDSLDALENAIENSNNDCDNNEDNSIVRFTEVITKKKMRIKKFKDDQSNETSNYRGYRFDFEIDGTVVVTKRNQGSNITINGFWTVVTGDDGDLEATFDFGNEPPLDILSRTWNVKKIKERRIRMKYKNDDTSVDRLIFQQLNN